MLFRSISDLAQELKTLITRRSTLYIAGNGGSYATATHAVCDFAKGISSKSNLSFKVHCLLDSITLLTAWSNDENYELAIANTFQNLVDVNDAVMIITGSGKSKNLVRLAEKAKSNNVRVISLTGFDGGEVKQLSDFNINVSSLNMQVIENIHMLIIHSMLIFFQKHDE